MKYLLLLLLSFGANEAQAWGKRGHFIIGSNAAEILAQNGHEFLRGRKFDMGFYNNVPDLVWKSLPGIYPIENSEHFLDLEIFQREMKADYDRPWEIDRLTFEKKYPSISPEPGRAFWRILELNKNLASSTQHLKEAKEDADFMKAFPEWIVGAGVMGHYVADLAQPFHCSENYDGQLTGQKGVHSFFEDRVVDSMPSSLESESLKKGQALWKKIGTNLAQKSLPELILGLSNNSLQNVPAILRIDKRIGRNDMPLALKKYSEVITERLAYGSVYLAEIWGRQLGWNFRTIKNFYFFKGEPAYIFPPKEAVK